MRKPITSIYRLVDYAVHSLFGLEEKTFTNWGDGIPVGIPTYSKEHVYLFPIFYILGREDIPVAPITRYNDDMSAYHFCIKMMIGYTYFKLERKQMSNEQLYFMMSLLINGLTDVLKQMDKDAERLAPSEKERTHIHWGCWQTDCQDESHYREIGPDMHELVRPLFDYIMYLENNLKVLQKEEEDASTER